MKSCFSGTHNIHLNPPASQNTYLGISLQDTWKVSWIQLTIGGWVCFSATGIIPVGLQCFFLWRGLNHRGENSFGRLVWNSRDLPNCLFASWKRYWLAGRPEFWSPHTLKQCNFKLLCLVKSCSLAWVLSRKKGGWMVQWKQEFFLFLPIFWYKYALVSPVAFPHHSSILS